MSGLLNDKPHVIYIYQPDTGMNLYQVEENKQKIRDLIKHGNLIINNFKDHLWALDMPTYVDYNNIYDITTDCYCKTDKTSALKIVADGLKKLKTMSPKRWNSLLAEASLVYQDLQNRGLYNGYELVKPIYDFTISGRSKTTGFNIQGASKDVDIRMKPDRDDIFIHIDWISADARACSILSKDEYMCESFNESDPYTVISEQLNDIDRDDVKLEMLESIYSLNYTSPVVEYFSSFKDWMQKIIIKIEQEGYAESLLGRKYYVNEGNNKTKKTVFNAAIQGTVAHAMQNTLCRLYLVMPECVLTEIHDSIVLVCDKRIVKDVISKAVDIMKYPFDGILEDNPVFPLKVSIGKAWKNWVPYKEFR